MFKVSIPTISKEELTSRYAQIKPVINVNGKLHYFREYTVKELTDTSYFFARHKDIREVVKADELVPLSKDFVCLHGYGYPGFFKPSIAEVLSQIDELDIPFVKAFELIEFPEGASDFHKDSFTSIAFNNGFHVSTVRLYGDKSCCH